MDIQVEYLVLLAAGVAVGSVFFPTAYRRWPSVATRYLKPEPWKRELAALIDAWICAILFVLLAALLGAMTALVLCPLCLLVRDRVLPGQSLGKILTGLVVIDLESGVPCGIARSIRRNVFFVVPGFNLVAVIFEARALRQDPQGMRLGDRFAGTMVIEGKDAKELVKALQERLLDLLVRGRMTRRPDSVVNRPSPGSGSPGRGMVGSCAWQLNLSSAGLPRSISWGNARRTPRASSTTAKSSPWRGPATYTT